MATPLKVVVPLKVLAALMVWLVSVVTMSAGPAGVEQITPAPDAIVVLTNWPEAHAPIPAKTTEVPSPYFAPRNCPFALYSAAVPIGGGKTTVGTLMIGARVNVLPALMVWLVWVVTMSAGAPPPQTVPVPVTLPEASACRHCVPEATVASCRVVMMFTVLAEPGVILIRLFARPSET